MNNLVAPWFDLLQLSVWRRPGVLAGGMSSRDTVSPTYVPPWLVRGLPSSEHIVFGGGCSYIIFVREGTLIEANEGISPYPCCEMQNRGMKDIAAIGLHPRGVRNQPIECSESLALAPCSPVGSDNFPYLQKVNRLKQAAETKQVERPHFHALLLFGGIPFK